MQKSKVASGEALQIALKRREVKSEGEKEGYTPLNADSQEEEAWHAALHAVTRFKHGD